LKTIPRVIPVGDCANRMDRLMVNERFRVAGQSVFSFVLDIDRRSCLADPLIPPISLTCLLTEMMKILIRYAPRAVGLMKIEK
jgi:hypothetical protein